MVSVPADLPGVDRGAVRLLRRVEYAQLVALGAFAEENVELVHGLVLRMPRQTPAHCGPIARLAIG